MTFEVRSVMSSQVSKEVAEVMVKAAESAYDIYSTLGDVTGKHRSIKLMDEYFFAVWPDLAELIESGKVGFEAKPNNNPRNQGFQLFFTYNATEEDLAVSFHSATWLVSLKFPKGTAEPELFQRFVDHEAEFARQRR